MDLDFNLGCSALYVLPFLMVRIFDLSPNPMLTFVLLRSDFVLSNLNTRDRTIGLDYSLCNPGGTCILSCP